jgi:hypothetical protein
VIPCTLNPGLPWQRAHVRRYEAAPGRAQTVGYQPVQYRTLGMWRAMNAE